MVSTVLASRLRIVSLVVGSPASNSSLTTLGRTSRTRRSSISSSRCSSTAAPAGLAATFTHTEVSTTSVRGAVRGQRAMSKTVPVGVEVAGRTNTILVTLFNVGWHLGSPSL